MSLSTKGKRARLLAIRDLVDANGGGSLQLFGGIIAETPETPADAQPLAIVALDAVSFDLHPTAASMTLIEAVGNASQSGLITWGRFVDGNGEAIFDALAGTPGSGAPIIVTDGQVPPSAAVYIGGEVTVNGEFVEV